jgi:ABC-2 type transport system permease protein
MLTVLNPMRWFLEILHGIALKGAGIGALWPAIAALTALALFFITLAAFRFRKTLG